MPIPEIDFFDLHGIKLRCASTSPRASAQLRDRLKPYLTPAFDRPDLFVTINQGDLANSYRIARMKKELTWVRSRPFWGEVVEDRLRLTDETSVSVTEYKNRHAHFRLTEETLADEHFSSRTFLLLPIIELLRTQGFFYMHGSLVSNGERSILFLGSGGSGKSTTAASFLVHGWKIVSDDNLLLHIVDSHTPIIHPLEQELSLSPETASVLSHNFSFSMERKKMRLSLDNLNQGGEKIDYANPTDIVVLDRMKSPGLTSLRSSRVLEILLQENPMVSAYPPLAQTHLESFHTLIQNTKVRQWSPPSVSPQDLRDLAPNLLAQLPA